MSFNECAFDGAQLLTPAEIVFNVNNKAIEELGRASAAIELVARQQLRLRCAMPSWASDP